MAEKPTYKLMKDEEFDDFTKRVEETEGWEKIFDKNGTTVYKKKTADSKIHAVKVFTFFADVSADQIYDTLHDHEYRAEWDENMIEGKVIEILDTHNEVGYYSAKMPTGITNRDFCNQRAWRASKDKGEYIIMNHSVPHPDCPEKKGFVRGISIRTGYLMRIRPEGGVHFMYYSQSDPKGWIPSGIINWLMTQLAPKIVTKFHKAAQNYPEWKAKHDPENKPWLKD
jgi:hypothetical protein